MNLSDLITRVKSNLRDDRGTAFLEEDIKLYINESIDRVKQVIPEMLPMKYLNNNNDIPIILPEAYHHLLSIYSSSRCFAQDERHYQATNLMNEFEIKLVSLYDLILSGEIELVDGYGDDIDLVGKPEYVFDNYFNPMNYDKDDKDEVF